MWYGYENLKSVYQTQLKTLRQKLEESLQQLEADVARMVRIALSSVLKNMMKCLAILTFN